MGKVIIVPSIQIAHRHPEYGHSTIHSVNGLSGDLIGTTHVPKSVPEIIDPLMQHFTFSRFNSKVFNKKKELNWITSSVRSDEVDRLFWDQQEIFDFASTLESDLLIQINSTDWIFAVCYKEDYAILNKKLYNAKEYNFYTERENREEIHLWLKMHCQNEYQVKEYSSKDRIFIRDYREAIHFKLRWYQDKS